MQSIEPIKTESWKRFQYAQNVQMTAQLNFESQRGQQSRNGDNSRKGHERTIMDSNGEIKAFQVRAIFWWPRKIQV